MTALLLAVGLTSATAAPASAIQTQSLSLATARASAAETYERRVQRLVNVRRANHGLSRLRLASCADGTAETWSRYLARRNQFFHQSMTTVLNTCNARYAGETLGRGAMTPRKLVRMWMNSPGHRTILLSKRSRRIGIGATPDAYGRWVVAANFIRF
ncbi:MAG TPA: CAP domain-containing protein [Nocardioidaceae bacterium]|nr:CAP domain-containing protein [Nocardioidaceae bacterium]